jgi:DNA-binding transcriptional regulator LsrR (DeoR family)
MNASERKVLNSLAAIKILINKNATHSQIAEYLDISEPDLRKAVISLRKRKFPLPKFPRKAPDKSKSDGNEKNRTERLDKVLQLRDTGKRTYEQIGEELGITRQRAHQLVKQAREESI